MKLRDTDRDGADPSRRDSASSRLEQAERALNEVGKGTPRENLAAAERAEALVKDYCRLADGN